MRPFRLAVALLTLACTHAASQFVPSPAASDFTHTIGHAGVPVRYKQVEPGICELREHVKSYTGYVDVAKDEHIFFWFFEARDADPKDAPLTVWINGGPGSSSMIGLFQENGPCGVDINGTVYDNPFSWSGLSNMLFIDQPTTTGLSYSKVVPAYVDPDNYTTIVLPSNECTGNASASGTCGTYSDPSVPLQASSTQTAAPNFWRVLQGFFGAFPKYTRHGFHFATESYGGHYGPVFSKYIEEQNAKKLKDAVEIKLESLLIINGWFKPLAQYVAYYNFTVYPGNTYDYRPYNKTVEKQLEHLLYGPGQCVDQLKKCNDGGTAAECRKADNFCAENIEEALDTIANRDEYDIRELQSDPFPYSFFVDYLNTPKVQRAIGAYQNFTTSSDIVGNAFSSTGDDARESGTIEAIRSLLEQGVGVTLIAGDADYNCNWLGVQEVAKEINHADFASAGFADLKTSDGITHGQVKQAGQFSFVRVYESGHEVPFYQPLAARELFERNIHGVDIATGKHKVERGSHYRTKGTAKSDFRNGNATVQWEVLDPAATYNTTTNAPNPMPPKRADVAIKPSTSNLSRFGYRKPSQFPLSLHE